MKKFRSALLLLMFLLGITTVGCSKFDRDSSEILADLETAGFVSKVDGIFSNLSEYAGNSGYDMSFDITDNAKFDTTNIYNCKALCSNSNFEISYNLKVTYKKLDGWSFSGYEIINTSSKINQKISNEHIINDVNRYFAQYGQTVEVDTSSIKQEFDDTGIGSEVSLTGSIDDGILTKECAIEVSYDFHNDWNISVQYSINSYDWDVQTLTGRKWVDTYKLNEGDFIYIESVNESDQTMMVGFRKGFYSSTIEGPYEEHGKPVSYPYICDEESVKIDTGAYTLEIYPDMHTMMSGYKIYPN